ncbi:patatin-like phospholipase family protein [Candidatus Harpocratesius sp.]
MKSFSNGSNKKNKTALVFAGGSALGAMEVGMLHALLEANIQPDFVVGTSVGALNAAYFAFHPNLEGVEELSKIWLSIKTSQIFAPSLKNSIKGIFQKQNYLISPKGLRNLLYLHFGDVDLSESQLQLYIIATDINSGEEVILSDGSLISALLASSAIPMIFPPVKIGHHELIDGGVVNNTPISTAVKLGATHIIVLPTGYTCDRKTTPKSIIEAILTTFSYMMHQKLGTDLELYKEQVQIHLIPPLCPLSVSAHDFSHSKNLIDDAYHKTNLWIKSGGFEKKQPPNIIRIHLHNTNYV